jgi:hypothetical protein
MAAAGVQLLERRVERPPPRAARGQRLGGVLAFEHEGLAHERFGAREILG